MPIYAYRCQSCGFAKDVLQKISDAPLTDCPECKQPSFKKQLTAAGFQLKGTGWYVTDFRGGSAVRRRRQCRPNRLPAQHRNRPRRLRLRALILLPPDHPTRHSDPRRHCRPLQKIMMRKYFLTGLLILVPLAITLWVLNLVIGTMDQSLLLLPESWRLKMIMLLPEAWRPASSRRTGCPAWASS